MYTQVRDDGEVREEGERRGWACRVSAPENQQKKRRKGWDRTLLRGRFGNKSRDVDALRSVRGGRRIGGIGWSVPLVRCGRGCCTSRPESVQPNLSQPTAAPHSTPTLPPRASFPFCRRSARSVLASSSPEGRGWESKLFLLLCRVLRVACVIPPSSHA